VTRPPRDQPTEPAPPTPPVLLHDLCRAVLTLAGTIDPLDRGDLRPVLNRIQAHLDRTTSDAAPDPT
jgi:hypothetical protein